MTAFGSYLEGANVDSTLTLRGAGEITFPFGSQVFANGSEHPQNCGVAAKNRHSTRRGVIIIFCPDFVQHYLAKRVSCSRSLVAAEAIREYVAVNKWQMEEIKERVEEADRGGLCRRRTSAARRGHMGWPQADAACRIRHSKSRAEARLGQSPPSAFFAAIPKAAALKPKAQRTLANYAALKRAPFFRRFFDARHKSARG